MESEVNFLSVLLFSIINLVFAAGTKASWQEIELVPDLSESEKTKIEQFLKIKKIDPYLLKKEGPEWDYKGQILRIQNTELVFSIYNSKNKKVASIDSRIGKINFENDVSCSIYQPHNSTTCSDKFLKCNFLRCSQPYSGLTGFKPDLGCISPTNFYLYDVSLGEKCEIDFALFSSSDYLTFFKENGLGGVKFDKDGLLIGIQGLNRVSNKAKLILRDNKDDYYIDLSPCLGAGNKCDLLTIKSSLWERRVLRLANEPTGKDNPTLNFYIKNVKPCVLKKDKACIGKYMLGHQDLKDKKYARFFKDKKETLTSSDLEELESCLNYDSFIPGEPGYKGKKSYCILNVWFDEKESSKIFDGKQEIPKFIVFDHIASAISYLGSDAPDKIMNGLMEESYIYVGE